MSYFFFPNGTRVCDQSHYNTGKLIVRNLSVVTSVNGPHVRDIFLHPLKQMGLQGELASVEMNEIPQLLTQWHRNGQIQLQKHSYGNKAGPQRCPVRRLSMQRDRYGAPFILIKATFSIR